jgi:PAS domain S-box-containing protein
LLYLENNLAPRVFVQARAAVLKLLASQAAIALENASLYRDVAQREAKIRRLVDANIIGTFIWKAADPGIAANDIVVIESNDAFLRMVGYDRQDLAAGRLSRSILTPPEWYERDAKTMTEVQMTGTVLPFEKEYLRKDGSRVPVLVGFAAFDEQQDQGVAFVVDLTERKRAEVAAREAQMELAHANRVAAIGQLSASIGHEINQPLSGVVTNAETGLLWLQNEPPNLLEAVGAFSRVVRDGRRASEIVNRIRALVKKAPPQKDKLHIDDAIHEIVGLTRSEAARHGVLVQTQLGEKLPPVQGDRVQLQQVILNLVVNAVEAISSRHAGPRDIVIETAPTESDDILVSVRDTGPGLDPANIERMFDAFYTTKADGLGMGLSICRSIIEAHGGKLWATAGAPRGAVFQFTLPAEQSRRVAQ